MDSLFFVFQPVQTMGSLTFMGSFGILKGKFLCIFALVHAKASRFPTLTLFVAGPVEHIKGMCAPDRIVFTTIYVASMIMTLYFTFRFGGISGYALVMASSGAQLMALLWYLVSFLPGGAMGLQYLMAMLGHILKPIIVACARFQAACIGRCISMWARGSS